MKTVIMAGGKGTRISELFPDIPKPLIPLSDGTVTKPLLEWEIESLSEQGFTDIILTVSHMADKIMCHFGDGSAFNVRVEYFIEEQPLGNAGALFKLRDKLTEDFLLLNADAVFDIDFNRLVKHHKESGAIATIFTHPNSHPYDSGIIVSDKRGSVQSWLTKEDSRPKYYKNRVNAGIHVLSPEVFDLSQIDGEKVDTYHRVDLDRNLLKPLCGTGRMYCYDSPEYVKDMGTPDRYEQVKRDFLNGVVKAKSLKNKQKAIFLDRDGTINKYVGFLRNEDEFVLLPGVAEAIKKINSSGYLAIVITNQPVIARGEVSVAKLETIHNKMETLLGKEGAYVDAIYYCPHHPHKGFAGEITELKFDCECRKPKPGMIRKACEDYNIDPGISWMVGDGENDILCGYNAGCKTTLIGSEDYNQDLSVESLYDAIDYICQKG